MPKYIDAEKLEKDGWLASRTYQQDTKIMVYETKKMIDFPIIDVVERKRGKWYDVGSLSCRCSECGCKSQKESSFCPNCGAEMEVDYDSLH